MFSYILFIILCIICLGGFEKPGMIKNLKGNSERNEVTIIIVVVHGIWY
jgi:hypothetical protein